MRRLSTISLVIPSSANLKCRVGSANGELMIGFSMTVWVNVVISVITLNQKALPESFPQLLRFPARCSSGRAFQLASQQHWHGSDFQGRAQLPRAILSFRRLMSRHRLHHKGACQRDRGLAFLLPRE